jgi:hypothetical protein
MDIEAGLGNPLRNPVRIEEFASFNAPIVQSQSETSNAHGQPRILTEKKKQVIKQSKENGKEGMEGATGGSFRHPLAGP